VLALDDSGTRHPDRKPGKKPDHGYDWFALGGIIFDEDDENEIRDLHSTFMDRWGITKPLHSVEIRAKTSNFAFLGVLESTEAVRFYEELYQLMRSVPVLGHACVVDRPQYNARYFEKYGSQRWLLCKSAFAIVLERSAKYARTKEAKLRVQIEQSDKFTDKTIKSYYDDIKAEGMPFAKDTSSKYKPANQSDLGSTLYEFRTKKKTSPLMQLADLFLWPLCMGGYNAECRPYARLVADKKVIDCVLEHQDLDGLGVKYYCFDNKKPG
jgi:hypothetical protein